MVKEISTQELKSKIDSGKKDFYLIDVLSEESFKARHIPGARNISLDGDFVERFEKEIGASKDAEIIVYCSSKTCQASPSAAAMLEKASYTNVAHYAGGIAGWQDAGYKFEEEK